MLRRMLFCIVFVFFVGVMIMAWSEKPLYELENNIIRLHIIANGDSASEQRLKINVRDALLDYVRESGNITTEAKIENISNEILKNAGVNYGSKASICKSYITRRNYENFTLPYAKYTAVKVELGKAKGKNWWCVLSPPLCFTTSAVGIDDFSNYLSDDTSRVISADKINIKFKTLEIASKIKKVILSE